MCSTISIFSGLWSRNVIVGSGFDLTGYGFRSEGWMEGEKEEDDIVMEREDGADDIGRKGGGNGEQEEQEGRGYKLGGMKIVETM